MNQAQKLKALNRALLITEEMQLKANEALWEDLNVLERERDTLWGEVFPLEEDKSLRLIVEKIVKINNALELQCSEARGKMRNKLRQMSSSQKALKAYGST